jgi:hypothetical protein
MPTYKLEVHPLWLSTTAYSIYLQLPSIFGGLPIKMTPEDMPYCGDKDLLNKHEHINATIKFLASECLLPYFLDVM